MEARSRPSGRASEEVSGWGTAVRPPETPNRTVPASKEAPVVTGRGTEDRVPPPHSLLDQGLDLLLQGVLGSVQQLLRGGEQTLAGEGQAADSPGLPQPSPSPTRFRSPHGCPACG